MCLQGVCFWKKPADERFKCVNRQLAVGRPVTEESFVSSESELCVDLLVNPCLRTGLHVYSLLLVDQWLRRGLCLEGVCSS